MTGEPTLRSARGGRRLAAWSLIGRDGACLIRLDDSRVSRTHASIEWRDEAWRVRDLGSANGTWVGKDRLGAEPVVLRPGDPLRFGAADAEAWELTASVPPVPFALRADGQEIGPHGELLVLPVDEQEGQWAIYRSATGHWVGERGDEQRAISDGELITVDSQVWRLCLPGRTSSTDVMRVGQAPRPLAAGEKAWSVESSRFEFMQSRDWEHAQLTLVSGEARLGLGDRQCWVVLVTLARERLADTDAPEHDQGWVDIDQLARELGMRRGTVDVYITRARTELADHGVIGAAGVVAARRGQRRLGVRPERVDILEG